MSFAKKSSGSGSNPLPELFLITPTSRKASYAQKGALVRCTISTKTSIQLSSKKFKTMSVGSNYGPYPPEPPKDNNKDNSQLRNGLIIVGILLALMIGLNIVQYFRGNTKVAEVEMKLKEAEKAKSDLQAAYDKAIAELAQLQHDFPAKEEEIAQLKQQLASAEAAARRSIDRGDYEAARARIRTLEATNATLEGEVADLKKQLAAKDADIAALDNQLSEMSQALAAAESKIRELEAKQVSTGDNNGETPLEVPSSEGEGTKTPVLKVDNVQATLTKINPKNLSQSKPSDSAKALSKCGKIDFSLSVSANPGVKPGEQEFFIKIMDGGGALQGKDSPPYNAMATLNYDGQSGTAQGSFSTTGVPLHKGSYNVIVYHKNMEVGMGTFSLSK